MADRRKKNINWNVADDQGETYNGMRDGVTVALLMDIRDELQTLNRLLHCQNFQNLPRTLNRIDRRLAAAAPLRRRKSP